MNDLYKLFLPLRMKILFTCLGNICRSPIAEGILRKKINDRNLGWTVSSNGTNRYHKGDPADPRAINVCKKHGIDIRNHIATRFKTADFNAYDLIVCMANDVYDEMQQFVTTKDQLQNVIIIPFHDPWYGDDEGFEACFQTIEAYCKKIIVNNC
jgi:protein-tyrosine phosphatase